MATILSEPKWLRILFKHFQCHDFSFNFEILSFNLESLSFNFEGPFLIKNIFLIFYSDAGCHFFDEIVTEAEDAAKGFLQLWGFVQLCGFIQLWGFLQLWRIGDSSNCGQDELKELFLTASHITVAIQRK